MFRATVSLALLVVLAVVSSLGRPATGGTSATTMSATNSGNEIPLSVFVVPQTPAEGRDPFFPRVREAAPVVAPVKDTAPAAIDTSALVLNGITGPPRRSAMINGRTFEKGEEAEVRGLGGTKFLVKCEEINDETIVIIIDGTLRRELRLRAGL